jgi:hypothetical protein
MSQSSDFKIIVLSEAGDSESFRWLAKPAISKISCTWWQVFKFVRIRLGRLMKDPFGVGYYCKIITVNPIVSKTQVPQATAGSVTPKRSYYFNTSNPSFNELDENVPKVGILEVLLQHVNGCSP